MFIIIIILGGLLTLYSLQKPEHQYQSLTPQIIDYVEKPMTEDDIEGKRQFDINCAMCHRINGRNDPPILKTNFSNYNLADFKLFIRNKKRERINDFDAECKPYPEMGNDKINYIYAYLHYKI